MSSDESEDSDITVTTFASFAQSKFSVRTAHTYSCSALQQPLLPLTDRADYLAALASWVTLLRIMGDLPDTDTGDTLVMPGQTMPTISKVKTGFKLKYTKKDVDEAHKKYSELFKDPVCSDMRSVPFLTGPADTMLDKVQMICALGIYRPNLRDEIYSQLCKQLTSNPSRNSRVRGWVLMVLLCSSFAPTEKFASVLNNFLCDGPVEFAERADKTLRRTCVAGTRCYPPSWLEFQAAKNGKPILVPVTLMNSHRLLCEIDASTTVTELMRTICERLGLKEGMGYSIFVALQGKISCLGNGQHRVLDAVSECEQHTKLMGVRESNALWRLFFRREVFTPWYVPGDDIVCTDLMYSQVKRGIFLGEYKLENEETMVEMLIKTYHIEYPNDSQHVKLQSFIPEFVPATLLERKPEDYYLERARATLGTMKQDSIDVNSLKAEIVAFAMDKFHVSFSRYHDVSRVCGPGLQLCDVRLLVSHVGLGLVDQQEAVRLQVTYQDIVTVTRARGQVTLTLSSLDDIQLTAHSAEVIYSQVQGFIEELRQRSKVGLAVQAFTPLGKPTDDEANASIHKGEVVSMHKSLAEGSRPGLGEGEVVGVTCQRTGLQCELPRGLVYVIPCLAPPAAHILENLRENIRKDNSKFVENKSQTQQTLQAYARVHFRKSTEGAVTKLLSKASFKRDKGDNLWSYSKDGLKKPLLKRTCQREDVRKVACYSFACLQSYMMNLVINDETTNYTLIRDWILEPARRNKYMRDEIFCQVIKQITNNPDKDSESRGWVLLTLLASLCCPSPDLADLLLSVTASSQHSFARRCHHILKGSRRTARRLYPSHSKEHDMVMKQHPNVRIQVCLPNGTFQTVEVTSCSRIFDIKKDIATRLNLRTFYEYSLFFTANDRVHCLPDRMFYFDCLTHSELYWFNKKRNSQTPGKPLSPLLVMLKKIWVNGQPDIDPAADQIFHFPQELPNFLRGYHKVSPPLVPVMAALVYRSLFGKDDSKLSDLSKISSAILPKGYLDGDNSQDTLEAIRVEYSNHTLSAQQAKAAFLHQLAKLPTYGSVFFEVKQRHVPTLPKYLLVAINYSGLHMVKADSKDVVKSFEFSSIPNWAFDDSSFTFIASEGTNTKRVLMETPVGHNMDDLLMSYIAWLMNYQMRKKHGHLGEMSGESIC